MTNVLYKGKVVLVPCYVNGVYYRFNGKYSYIEVSCELIEGAMREDGNIIDQRLVIEPTEEQLAEIERYGN